MLFKDFLKSMLNEKIDHLLITALSSRIPGRCSFGLWPVEAELLRVGLGHEALPPNLLRELDPACRVGRGRQSLSKSGLTPGALAAFVETLRL